MQLVAEPHKNTGGARAALPSGRLRFALLGKLVSCHWRFLITAFQWFGERRKRKKKSSSQIPLLFYIPSLHVLPLLFQISGMTSPEELPNQPHMQREKQASRKTRALQKEDTNNLYFHYPFSCSFGVQANETQLFTAPWNRGSSRKSNVHLVIWTFRPKHQPVSNF